MIEILDLKKEFVLSNQQRKELNTPYTVYNTIIYIICATLGIE